MSEPERSIPQPLAWGLVIAQLLFLVLLAAMPWGSLWPRGIATIVLGLAVVALGLAIAGAGGAGLGRALTPSPIPKADAQLITTGIYVRVRHPIYTGLLVIGLGLVVIGASVLHLLAFIALLSVLMTKARLEEWMLLSRHPDYAAYAARVGRLVPGIGRLR